MSHTVWFDIPLTCLRCGKATPGRETQMYTSGLLVEPMDRFVEKGEAIEAELADFEEAYICKRPPEAPAFYSLEEWTCKNCGATQWARLEFQQQGGDSFQFVDAETVSPDRKVLSDVQFITSKAESWAQYNLGPEAEVFREALDNLLDE